MATNLSDFVNGVMQHVSGCPKNLVIEEVRNAAIRLCEDSTIWRDDIPAGDITADVDDYTITPPAGTRVMTLISLLYDDLTMYPKTEEELDHLDDGWRTGRPGDPNYFVLLAPDRVKFNRIPEKTISNGLVAKVVLKPTNTATTVADILFYDWFEAIKHGALERLLRIPKKPWSDIKLSMFHGKHFNFQIQRATARATSNFSRKPASVKMRKFV